MPKIKLPYIPDVVDLNHLQNGRLLSQKQITDIKAAVEREKISSGKISKNKLKEMGIESNYSVFLSEGKIFTIYHGEKQDRLLGKGSNGKVKVGQDEDGKFVAIKFVGRSKISLEKEILKLEGEIKQKKLPLKKLEGELTGLNNQIKEANDEKLITELTKKISEISNNITDKDIDNNISIDVNKLNEVINKLKIKLNNATKGIKNQSEADILRQVGQLEAVVDHAMIMQIADGDEMQFASLYYKTPHLSKLKIARDVCSQLNDLHENKGLIHFDIKSENIKVNVANGIVSIVDFGASSLIADTQNNQVKGSPANMPPEMFQAFLCEAYKDRMDKSIPISPPPPPSVAIDVYCAGIVIANLFGLITGRLVVLPDKKNFNVRDIVKSDNKAFKALSANIGNENANELLALLNKMTAKIPSERISIKDAEKSLDKIFQALAKEENKKINITIVNVDEFLSMSKADRSSIINRVGKFDQVQLVHSEDTLDNIDRTQLARKIFDDELIVVRQDVYLDSNIRDLKEDDTYGMMKFTLLTQNIPIQSDQSVTSNIKTTQIQSIPKKIDLSDIKEHGLLTHKQFNQLKKYCAERKALFKFSSDGAGYRLKKKELQTNGIMVNYAIDVSMGKNNQLQFVVIYKGEKHKKELGKGAEGKVKLGFLTREADIVIVADKTRKAKTKDNVGVPCDESIIINSLDQQVGHTFYTSANEHKDPNGKMMYGRVPVESLSMDLVPGKPLSEIKNMSFHQAMNTMLGILKSVQKLHQSGVGVLHCDIKPDNIMVDLKSDGKINLIDFGVSLLKSNDDAVVSSGRGTRGFCAPEISPNSYEVEYSNGTDIYSVGKTFEWIKEQINKNDLKDNEIHIHELDNQIEKMVKVNPGERLSSLSDVIVSLEKIQLSLPKIPLKVAVFDLRKFENSNSDEREILIGKLKKFDEVYLVYTGELQNKLSASVLVRQLEDNGISVNSHITDGSCHFDELFKERRKYADSDVSCQRLDITYQAVGYEGLTTSAQMTAVLGRSKVVEHQPEIFQNIDPVKSSHKSEIDKPHCEPHTVEGNVSANKGPNH